MKLAVLMSFVLADKTNLGKTGTKGLNGSWCTKNGIIPARTCNAETTCTFEKKERIGHKFKCKGIPGSKCSTSGDCALDNLGSRTRHECINGLCKAVIGVLCKSDDECKFGCDGYKCVRK